MKVLSFSLWGSEPRYLAGALENARLARELYPGWVCRFYCGPDVEIGGLLALGAEVRRETPLGPFHGLFWRFFPASEPGVERFLVRDADSRLNPREVAAVAAWEASGRAWHVMRDHRHHVVERWPIPGGMWGGRGGLVPDMRAWVRDWGRFDAMGTDQDFLARRLWPLVRRDCLQHNSWPSFWGGFDFPGGPLPDGAFVGMQHFDVSRPAPGPAVEDPPWLTLLAIPKPFEGHIGVIQENALESWGRLRPRPDIVLVGDEPGTAEAARRFGAVHVPGIARNEWGTPLYDDLLRRGQAAARTELICHVNADILLLDDFCQAALEVRSRFSRFLMLGRRTDVDVTSRLAFAEGEVRSLVATGRLGGPHGVEFFLFPRLLLTDAPPFAIGRFFHDSWPIVTCRERGIPVVDATEVVTVAHQRHGYNQKAAPVRGLPYLDTLRLPEDGANHRLLGGEGRRFSIAHATHRLTSAGMVPLRRWPLWWLKLRCAWNVWQLRLERAWERFRG